jgi:hypothetical protein
MPLTLLRLTSGWMGSSNRMGILNCCITWFHVNYVVVSHLITSNMTKGIQNVPGPWRKVIFYSGSSYRFFDEICALVAPLYNIPEHLNLDQFRIVVLPITFKKTHILYHCNVQYLNPPMDNHQQFRFLCDFTWLNFLMIHKIIGNASISFFTKRISCHFH